MKAPNGLIDHVQGRILQTSSNLDWWKEMNHLYAGNIPEGEADLKMYQEWLDWILVKEKL